MYGSLWSPTVPCLFSLKIFYLNIRIPDRAVLQTPDYHSPEGDKLLKRHEPFSEATPKANSSSAFVALNFHVTGSFAFAKLL